METLRVRKMEERYERGEVDSKPFINVTSRRVGPKRNTLKGSADDPAVVEDATGHTKINLLAPSRSIEQPSTSRVLSIKKLGATTQSILSNLTLARRLIFEIWPGSPLLAISPPYLESCSPNTRNRVRNVAPSVPTFNFVF